MASSTTVKVAAAQLPHVNYDVAGNIRRGVAAVEEAASKGAQLVLLPEFFSSGFLFLTELWEMAEVLEGGPTLTAMMEVSQRCTILVGYSFLEAVPLTGDFFNTFVLVEPDGRRHVCRKSEPAALEAWVFAGDASLSPILDTSLGKIAVNICYENMLIAQQHRLLQPQQQNTPEQEQEQDAVVPFDMLLCPHSAPTPNECLSFPKGNVVLFNKLISQAPKRMASLFGVPVVLSNKVGPIYSRNPFPWFMIPTHHTFHGWSSICADNGTVLAAAATNPQGEVIVAEVQLWRDNSDNKKLSTTIQQTLNCLQGRYLVDLPWPLPFVWTHIMEPMGRWSYARSHRQRTAAVQRAVERGSQPSTYRPITANSEQNTWLLASISAVGLAVLVSFVAGESLPTIKRS